MYLSNFPITRHIECTWNQTLQEYNFIPVVGNFAQEFSPEGVAFDIFFCKSVKSPPPPPSGLTLIGALFYVVQCQHWRPFKYDENVKQSHQLDSAAQQMHSINKWDIFFTYVVNIFWISISLLNIITAKFPFKYWKYIDHSEIGPPVIELHRLLHLPWHCISYSSMQRSMLYTPMLGLKA
jgi:hypothetical protein